MNAILILLLNPYSLVITTFAIWLLVRIIRSRSDINSNYYAIGSFVFIFLMSTSFIFNQINKICVTFCDTNSSFLQDFIFIMTPIFFVLSIMFSIKSLSKENKKTAIGLIILNVAIFGVIMIMSLVAGTVGQL